MRTKALLGLAALAASAIGAYASNVYSLNVVGYINTTLHEGGNVLAPQLDLDGTGLNNTVAGIFSSNLPLNTAVYKWGGASWGAAATFGKDKSGNLVWSGDFPLNPGQAAFVIVPAGAYGGGSGSVTTVGNVLQGSLVNQFIPAGGGFWAIGSKVPLSGTLQANLLYTPHLGDQVYKWLGTAWSSQYAYAKDKSGNPVWSPGDPPIGIAEGFFLNAAPGGGWTQNFTVQ